MKRHLFLAFAIFSYLLFLALFAYMACFFGNFLIPHTIDGPVRTVPGVAVLINLLLVLLFGLQHSVMARPRFKKWWTRFIPQPIERSMYVFVSNIAVILLVVFWQPIGPLLWDVQSTVGRALIYTLFAAGWLMVPAVSLLIHHFDLFGLRQVWLYYQGKEYTPLPFRTPALYRRVRHPLYIGWALAFVVTPAMTLGHLLLALSLIAYMVIATMFEERNLVDYFGEKYATYQQQVPRFIPIPGRVARTGESGDSGIGND